MKPSNPPEYPLNGLRPKSVILSHAHIDHSGIIPSLMDMRPEIYMTSVTRDIMQLLAKDTLKIAEKHGSHPFYTEELRQLMEQTRTMNYREPFRTASYKAELYDAGHIPGSASIHLMGEQTLFYTGDIKTTETRLIERADADYPQADILIIESTYYGQEHTPRDELEKQFIESVIETLDQGGNVIVPCFAVGRTQEMVMILTAHGITPYVDGMGKDVQAIFEKYPMFLRDAQALEAAFTDAIMVNRKQRDAVLKEPSVVVTTAGMLNGGPAMYYLGKIYDDPMSALLLTGYQVKGTNGRRALEQGEAEIDGDIVRLKLKVGQYDFSAHSDDRELKQIVRQFCDNGTQMVFTVHGEETGEFAEWIRDNEDVQAIAPENGDEFIIE